MQSNRTTRPVTPMSADAGRARLIEEYGEHCFRCLIKPDEDRRQTFAVDHIVPVARGGQNVYENYQLLCGPCNSWKRTKIIDFRPGKSRQEITVDLPIIPNEQRARRDRSRKPEMEIIVHAPTPDARVTAQIALIKQLRVSLTSAEATIDGLRLDLDDERERAVRAEAEADELRERLARRRWYRWW